MQFLNKGAFGEVYLYDNKAYKISPIVKKKQSPVKHNLIDNTLREAVFYIFLQNEDKTSNITSSLFDRSPESIMKAEVNLDGTKVILKMNYIPKTLSTIKYENKNQVKTIFYSLLQACEWLHQRSWSHGDIKPANILIGSNNYKTYLIDYTSIMFHSCYKMAYQRCTLYYVSPEELLTCVPSPSTDIWSFGCVLFEFVVGYPFILGLMKHMETSTAIIDTFIEHINKNNESFNSHDFLVQFYSNIMYGNIHSFLMNTVKDRDILSVLCHCFFLDVKHRKTASWLLTNEKLFNDKNHIIEKLDIETLHIEVNNITESYTDVIHANVSFDDRQKLFKRCIQVIRLSDIDFNDDIFFHTIMLFDRACFRNPEIDKEEAIIFSLFVSAIMLFGNALSLEDITTFVDQSILDTYINLLNFIFLLDFKVFNLSPDLYFNITNEYDIKQTSFIDKCVELAMMYPLTHSSLAFIVKNIKDENILS
jgi:serine/threonine protein kinase